MPNGLGHWHVFAPVPNAVVTGPLAACSTCLGFADEPVHVTPAGMAARREAAYATRPTAVKCSQCGAAPGAPCFNRDTHRPLKNPHPVRARAARIRRDLTLASE